MLLRNQQGSAILLVLLLLTGFSGVIFTMTQSVRSVNRQQARGSFTDEARAQAQAGIDEGIYRIRQGQLDSRGEYGTLATTAGVYRLTPYYRGYTRDASGECTVSQTNFALLDKGCPYYSISVRRMVGGSEPGEPILRSQDVPAGIPVSFGYFTSQLIPKQQLLLAPGSQLFCSSGCSGDGGFTQSPQNYLSSTDFFYGIAAYNAQPAVPATQRGVLTLQVTGAAGQPLLSVAPDVTPGNGYSALYQRPNYTIIATGYSGGTRRSLLATIPASNLAATPTLLDFTGEVSSKGYIYQ